MASGLPAISTDLPVFREFLDRSDAVLVPLADAAALSRAMLAVAIDPALRQRLALTGPKVAARYTWETCARQHRAIYDRFVRVRGSAPPDS